MKYNEYKIFATLFVFLFINFSIYGQNIAVHGDKYFATIGGQTVIKQDSITQSEIIAKLLAENNDSVVIIDVKKIIEWRTEARELSLQGKSRNWDSLLIKKYKDIKIRKNKAGQIILTKYLYLTADCVESRGSTGKHMNFIKFEFSKGCYISIHGSPDLIFNKCTFKERAGFHVVGHARKLKIDSSSFERSLEVASVVRLAGEAYSNDEGSISITHSVFYPQQIYHLGGKLPPKVAEQQKKSRPYVFFHKSIAIHGETPNFTFQDNKILKGKTENTIAVFKLNKTEFFRFERNLFEVHADLSEISVENRLFFRDNVFKGRVCLNEFIFTERFNKIDWEQLQGEKLVLYERKMIEWNERIGKKRYKFEIPLVCFYTPADSLNEDLYKDLTATYQSLYKIFTDNGDIESANGCYAEKKDLEGFRLKHQYEKKGGFRTFINYWLNRLLKFYTNHGTDPALSIVISIYVIVCFAVIYFFFPSEWDVDRKSTLLGNFKKIFGKEHKGFMKPFLYVITGFMISFMNALMLSVNSFITLGFGNIPTSGFARYICIIQGFIGWFLLSIFTVALMNQVLS